MFVALLANDDIAIPRGNFTDKAPLNGQGFEGRTRGRCSLIFGGRQDTNQCGRARKLYVFEGRCAGLNSVEFA